MGKCDVSVSCAVSSNDLYSSLHAASAHDIARADRQGRTGAWTVDGTA